jgi:hypothetical protein
VTERVFADPSLLDAIVLDPSTSHQDGDAGGSAPSDTLKAEEGVLGKSTTSTESAAIEPPSPTAGETTDAPLLEPIEAAVVVPTPSMVGAFEEAVRGAEPSSPQPTTTTVEEVPASSQPTTVPQEHDAPEGATRAASPEIQEAGEKSGVALPRDVGGTDARILELACVLWLATSEVGDDVEDDEEAAACNTLERRLVSLRTRSTN